MPRVKALTKEDPTKAAIRAEVREIMGYLNVSQAELARMTGIPASTLSLRIGRRGNIGSLKLDEFLAIRRVAAERGYKKGEQR